MSERQEHRQRLNARIAYAAAAEKKRIAEKKKGRSATHDT